MADVAVDKEEWLKLHKELGSIREVNSFMVKHVNTKWEV
jgi:hypothetical protein